MKKLRQIQSYQLLRVILGGWIKVILVTVLFISCNSDQAADGLAIENQALADNHLNRDFTNTQLLEEIIKDINCTALDVLKRQLVLSEKFHLSDTAEILLIPYISNGKNFKSSAYSDIKNRFILINPSYIREFTLKNILNDTLSYKPVLELMLLHELGHFILEKSGAFDEITDDYKSATGEMKDETQPALITTIKKVELSADSLAIDMIKRKLHSIDYNCLSIVFDVERIVPGMQFQLSGTRMVEHFGSSNIAFLHDPSSDHPNLELRITFMNYFLFPNDSLKIMIDDYLYNRTVTPVHQQEFNPQVYQGQEKNFLKKNNFSKNYLDING